MGLFGKGKKDKGDDHKAPAINPGPLREVPQHLPEVSPGAAGAGFETGKPILPANQPGLMPPLSPKPAHAAPPAKPTRKATLRPSPLPERDLVDLATADDDVTSSQDDPSKSATGQLKIALKQQGVDTGQQVMVLLEQIEKQLSQLQQLRTERQHFMADLDQRKAELETRESRIKELEEEARENHRIVDQLKAQADQDTDTLKREKSALESSRQLLEAQRKTIEAHQKSLNEQKDKFEQDAKALDEARSQLAQDRAQAQHTGAAALAEHEAELARLRDQVEAVETQHAQARAHAATLEQQLAEAHAAVATLRSDLAHAQDQAGPAEAEALQTAQAAIAHAQREIARRDRAIELLTQQLDEATQPSPAPAHTGPDEFLATRRARLSRMRREVNERARKLQLAHNQLRDRKKELDQKAAALSAAGGPMSGIGENQRTLKAERQQLVDYAEALKTERNKLVQLMEQVERKARKTNARAAQHRASTMLFSIVGSLAVVAAGSWIAAQRFAEAAYIATVTIKADAPASDATPVRLESWTNAHVAMLDDPQFHEKAADRLRSRGIKDLSSPTAVRQFVGDAMTIEASEPGQIRLTATGIGAPRTERVLDSFASAVASHSNSMRDFRSDGLPTVVATAAAVDPTPVEDPRLQLFGMIFGGASAVLLFGGLLLWRRIASDQQAFEEKIKLSEGGFEDVLPPPMLGAMQHQPPQS